MLNYNITYMRMAFLKGKGELMKTLRGMNGTSKSLVGLLKL